MLIKKITLTLLASCTPLVFNSCHSPCMDLPANTETSRYSQTGVVTKAESLKLGLNAEETELLNANISQTTGGLLGTAETQDEADGQNFINTIISTIAGSSTTKAGQRLTIKTKDGSTIRTDQPVYCQVGELKIGQKVARTTLYGRDVFLPL